MNPSGRLFKPGVPRSVHLFTAPFLWAIMGGLLMFRGWSWLDPGSGWLTIPVAATVGTVKSLLILDRAAARVLLRIERFDDGACLGAVYSWKTWLLVLLMAVGGMALRRMMVPGTMIGSLYFAIGWSLCLSSRLGWRRWLQSHRDNGIA